MKNKRHFYFQIEKRRKRNEWSLKSYFKRLTITIDQKETLKFLHEIVILIIEYAQFNFSDISKLSI